MTFLGGLNRGLQQGLNRGMDVADRRKSREIGLARAQAELELLRLRATGQAMENAEQQERTGLAMEPTTVRQHTLDTPEFGAERSAFVRDLGGALSGGMQPGPQLGENALGSGDMGIPEPRGLPPLTPGVTRVGPSADDREELAEFDMTTAIADELQGRQPQTSRRAALLAAGGKLDLPKPETPRMTPWEKEGFGSEAEFVAYRRRAYPEAFDGRAPPKPERVTIQIPSNLMFGAGDQQGETLEAYARRLKAAGVPLTAAQAYFDKQGLSSE